MLVTNQEKDQHASMTDQIARLEAENSRLRGVKGQVDDATRDAWIIKEESFVSKIKYTCYFCGCFLLLVLFGFCVLHH